jgi:hypothetical protein
MIDLIYNFIRNTLIGQNTTIQGADDLALLLSFATIILIFFVLVKLVIWAFKISSGHIRSRRF